ncbi:MAG TPA: hypothetical protein VJB89_01420 [Candidatus Nanoarchaeia archaeon]|nr:hypothetical protein [Candidatus Nanoarchaeia archaeon]
MKNIIYLIVLLLIIGVVNAESLYILDGYDSGEWTNYGGFVDYNNERLYLENSEILNNLGNTWVDYTEEFDFLVESGRFNFGFYQSDEERYYVQFRQTVFELYKEKSDGSVELLTTYIANYLYNEEYHMKIYVSDSLIDVFVEDINIIHYSDVASLFRGSVGFEVIDGKGYISNLNIVGIDYCDNLIMDYDEVSVDCGGSCDICKDVNPIDDGTNYIIEQTPEKEITEIAEEEVLTEELDEELISLDEVVIETLKEESYCGDGVCNIRESRYGCPDDCKSRRGLRFWFIIFIVIAVIVIILIILLIPKQKIVVVRKKKRKK